MKDYKNPEEIINDLRNSLADNPFDKYTKDRLDNPKNLIREFKNYPNLRLEGKVGWFFVWKNQLVQIDAEWVRIEDILNRLGELI